ncbi:MAG: mandelate racemase/muconate lactonizing enzyme family protein [Sphaerobacteraceae bacterium]|nr:MAG: mandelate racemase/muconate lactonizing enzyme family protein [Sphaerobacteraceae bacterium]
MKITGARTRLYEFEMSRPIGDANLPEGTAQATGMLLFIDSDEGVSGVAIGGGAPGQIQSLVNDLLLGEDPRGVKGLWQRMNDAAFKGGNRGEIGSAISTIDLALWDLKARLNNEPLWKTLGASSNRVRAYASGIDLSLNDDEITTFYTRMASQGIQGGKLKLGVDLESDEHRLGLMRDALATSGKRPELMIDSNEYWSPKQAIRHIRHLEKTFDITWAEEPARRWDVRGLRQVSQSINAAVATGENLDLLPEFTPLLLHEAADVINLGQGSGGITGMLQIADLAYAFDRPVTLMNCPGNFMAPVAACLPNHIGMEVVDAGRDVCFDVDSTIEDGWIVLGDSPGNGITVDESRLAAIEVERFSPGIKAGSWPRRAGGGMYEIPTR